MGRTQNNRWQRFMNINKRRVRVNENYRRFYPSWVFNWESQMGCITVTITLPCVKPFCLSLPVFEIGLKLPNAMIIKTSETVLEIYNKYVSFEKLDTVFKSWAEPQRANIYSEYPNNSNQINSGMRHYSPQKYENCQNVARTLPTPARQLCTTDGEKSVPWSVPYK